MSQLCINSPTQSTQTKGSRSETRKRHIIPIYTSIPTLLVSYTHSDGPWIQMISITFAGTYWTYYNTTAAAQRVIHPRTSHGKPRITAVSCALEYAETETRDERQERDERRETRDESESESNMRNLASGRKRDSTIQPILTT